VWEEVTREESFRLDEQRYRVAERLRRLNDLGFDVDEVELITSEGGARLRVDIRVAEIGRHRRELFRLTGLEAQENQARRLLNDLRSFRAYLEQRDGRPVPATTAAHLWRSEVYDPVVAAVPPDLLGVPAPADLFHGWCLSENAGRDVGMTAALRSYLAVLPHQHDDQEPEDADP
jgi:hypothetical protein